MAELESPSSAEALYRYRGNDVSRSRPVFQGDVFTDIEIPGLDDGPGLAMVVSHACSMRAGPRLRERLVVARVVPRASEVTLPWSGNYRVLPLPDLLPGSPRGHWATQFEDIGTVRSEDLTTTGRVACLDDVGVLLLQQRHAHHMTRYVVETSVLYEQCANVLTEAELLEDWIEAAVEQHSPEFDELAAAASVEFDSFLAPHRSSLVNPATRAAVRRSVGQEISRRFG